MPRCTISSRSWVRCLLLAACLTARAAAASTPVDVALAIDEELPIGREVANLRAELERSGHPVVARGLDAEFRLFNSAPAGVDRYFRVSPASGVLSIGQRLDRDGLCSEAGACCDPGRQCRLVLQVQSDREYTYILSVDLVVKDLNDNAPRWGVGEIAREFSEGSMVGEFRTIPPAEDPDSSRNSVQRYEILAPKPLEFELEHEAAGGGGGGVGGGPLRLYLRQTLDRESRDVYRMRIAAFDGGYPPRNGTVWLVVTVTDENDERPTFEKEQYVATVLENARPGTEILQLKATDRDAGLNGQVLYSIPSFAPARIRALFSVDASTGVLRVAGQLDYEKQHEIQLTVVAQDRSPNSPRQGTTQVLVRLIDVNDEKPRIMLNSDTDQLSVIENEPAGKTVTLLTVTDNDSGINGEVTCTLKNYLDMFALQSLNMKGATHYNLVTARPLDRETDSANDRPLTLTVQCVDGGQPANTVEKLVPVSIGDQNDNRPVFAMSTYHFGVNERTRPGAEAFALTATDRDAGRNALLTFWLNGTDAFSVNADGRGRLIRPLDREARDRHQFLAGVSDHGLPPLTGTATVVILVEDDNDHVPAVRALFSFRVLENATKGQTIGQLNATDADEGDNARLTYRMADPNCRACDRFSVDSHDGHLVLIGRLDREETPRHQFVVLVVDFGQTRRHTASTTVVVDVADVNDCPPRFLYPTPGNASLRLSPGTPVATTVATVVAVDDDDADAGDDYGNGRVRYAILSAAAGSPFHLDADTGQLVLVRPLTPELLAGRLLRLRLVARDGGRPPLETTQTLTVTVAPPDGQFSAGWPPQPQPPPASWPEASGAGPDSLLVAAGLASVTCAFVLILGLGVGVIVCRRRCIAALVGQTQDLQQQQQRQSRGSRGRRRRKHPGSTAASEAETLPMTAASARISGSAARGDVNQRLRASMHPLGGEGTSAASALIPELGANSALSTTDDSNDSGRGSGGGGGGGGGGSSECHCLLAKQQQQQHKQQRSNHLASRQAENDAPLPTLETTRSPVRFRLMEKSSLPADCHGRGGRCGGDAGRGSERLTYITLLPCEQHLQQAGAGRADLSARIV